MSVTSVLVCFCLISGKRYKLYQSQSNKSDAFPKSTKNVNKIKEKGNFIFGKDKNCNHFMALFYYCHKQDLLSVMVKFHTHTN